MTTALVPCSGTSATPHGECWHFRMAECPTCEVMRRSIPEPRDVGAAVANNPNRRDLRLEASRWIAENAERYDAICVKAAERHRAGHAVNVSMLAEWLRLDVHGVRDRIDGYKLNNNHRAYIARRMVADHPELEPCFRFRETRY